ncbi:hypothetical protein COCMIDRAFT_94012 [Bipolaris oryzae ATCC 44560]|uniref:Peptidase A1 domain-containing protein n=1 Tax=Bipolaris oryzae ATCC 44560 TaxID=930090 RepID=W6ZEQ3_COCMI|nr:uncharacterized protein COCMIDRAFT_94012 [Bipolaris oryzae ATCC 44560]EUC45989.1 hypothetical protein COCMIDRAFT_94012 [Bipolaris oryzae ATCC 44560]
MVCPNGSEPLLLPWTNHSVSADGAIFSKGISFAIGTPPQLFSLTPSTTLGNAFINSVTECGSATNSSCIGQLSGIYDSAASTSFVQVDYAAWAGSREPVNMASGNSHIFFTDTAAFGPKNATNKFPALPMYTNGSTDITVDSLAEYDPGFRATLPLGMDSSFLNLLVDSGQASSRTYGLWAGSESEDAPQPGLLVVGGYDESRLKSPATKFPMFSDCPTCAVLTAITYDVGSTSTTLFEDAKDTLTVHLDPFSTDIRFPQAMLEKLAAAEKTAVWNETSRHFELPTSPAPTGTITITISDMGSPAGDASKPSVASYKTVIPASELYYRPRAYNSAGVFEVNNATVFNMAVTNQTESVTVGILGFPFFTQNYLIVDPDAANYELAPAVVAAADLMGADAKVKQVCRILPGTKPSSQTAALAGAVVGSVIGTLFLIALAWYIRRRRKNTTTPSETNQGPVIHRLGVHESEESKSLELPRQGLPPLPQSPAAAAASTPETRGITFPSPPFGRMKSVRTGNQEDPRRGLVHDTFKRVDEVNDGRLLDERPLGLSETIHSRGTLPRLAAEHTVE